MERSEDRRVYKLVGSTYVAVKSTTTSFPALPLIISSKAALVGTNSGIFGECACLYLFGVNEFVVCHDECHSCDDEGNKKLLSWIVLKDSFSLENSHAAPPCLF